MAIDDFQEDDFQEDDFIADDSLPTGAGKVSAIREEYPSEKFSKFTKLPSRLAGMFAKVPGIGMLIGGAASGAQEAARQGISYLAEEPKQPDVLSRARMVGEAALEGAAGEAVGRGMGAVAGKTFELAKPRLVKTGAQLMKVTAGIPEQTGKQVLSSPSILSKAKSLDVVGDEYNEALKAVGLNRGPSANMEKFGKMAITENEAISFADKSYKEFIDGKLTFQDAMIARDNIKSLIARPKFQNPLTHEQLRALEIQKKTFDNYLEDYFNLADSSFSKIRKDYGDAKAKEVFQSWFPENANKTASVLRGSLALGSVGLGAGGQIDPTTAAAGVALSSPRLLGYGIRTGRAVAPAISLGAKTGVRLGAQQAYEEMAPDALMLRRKYMEQK